MTISTQKHRAAAALLCCIVAAGCDGKFGGGTTPKESAAGNSELPLLGSSRARSYIVAFCEGDADGVIKPDDAVLPADPRSLIRPGINAGRAVAFNAYWQDCTGPSQNPLQRPLTCGEFRSRSALGQELLRSGLAMSNLSAESYNNLWQRWGLSARPDDFDAQVRERYGLPVASYNNPYPLPGETGTSAKGGSGQLPGGLTQLKNPDGSYSGELGMTCDVCHSGELKAHNADAPYLSGLGAHTADFQLFLTDTLAPVPLGFNGSRGVTNAEGLSGLLIGLLDIDSLGLRPDTILLTQVPGNTSGAGDTKMPAWWNASRRPRKFWDGGFSYDAARLASAILNLTTPTQSPSGTDKVFNKALRDLIETQSLLAETYFESLEAPHYPGAIDTKLAEAGAVLFHAKDLWANDANADIPRPPTNGSCAGCHGAYAPRYVHDPAFLEDPRLEGIAAYIAPLEQIRTDRQRFDGFSPALLETMSTSWFSYPEGTPGYVSPDDKDALTERSDDLGVYTPGQRPKGACTWQGTMPEDAVGYLAPPLHGVWATAPYLHNGSVPDIWALLKPDERPAVWRRALTQGAGPERGFDTSFTAYDEQRMGWKYDELLCGGGGVPYLSCEPDASMSALTLIIDFINTFPGTLNSVGYQVQPPLGRDAIEARKIFNTHQFAKSNAGHDFTRALSDMERQAIIEYLKTL